MCKADLNVSLDSSHFDSIFSVTNFVVEWLLSLAISVVAIEGAPMQRKSSDIEHGNS